MKNKIKPKNKNELIEIIKNECYTNGWQCDLNFIDTSLITDMSYLFSIKSNLNQFNGVISNWNTSNVINMSSMFLQSYFNNDISNWDTSSVNDMSSMFYQSYFNKNISNWDTSCVTDMSSMFENSNWNTSNVIIMNSIFKNSLSKINTPKWYTSNKLYPTKTKKLSFITKFIHHFINKKN
jgi:surface protein